MADKKQTGTGSVRLVNVDNTYVRSGDTGEFYANKLPTVDIRYGAILYEKRCYTCCITGS